MFWTNVKRIVRTGFFNFWRNGTVSLASVLTMIVTLLVIGFIIMGSAVLKTSLDELRNKVDINITFIPKAAEEDVLSIKHSLETLPEVARVEYTSKEAVLEQFKERHADDQAILAALDELNQNPFGAALNVKAKDPSQYQSVANFLQGKSALPNTGLTIIDQVNYYQNKTAIDKLTSIITAADKLGLVLALAFIILSVITAFNTIRLTIYISRDEIGVMRLVGASTAYIQGPFIVVGMIYGLMAGILTLVILAPITYWLGHITENFFIGFNVFLYYLHNLPQIFLIIILGGLFIGAISSVLAIRKYLKV
ncbi:ABC transporter permease [Candidatus Parcubacteria bacterium]|nr:ABC transporter permease [Candidatus Parcubacteria bacterium]